MNYYHYTKGGHLLTILDKGYLKTSRMGTYKSEKHAVNLTTSEKWEATVDYRYSAELQGGRIRFIITPNISGIITWAKYKYVGKIKPYVYDTLDSSARQLGSDTSKWFISLDVIPKKYWMGFEVLVKGEWRKPYTEAQWQDYITNGTIMPEVEETCNKWRQAKVSLASEI